MSSLSLFLSFTCEIIDNRGQWDVIYPYFRKTFNQMNHFLLIKKINCIGFLKSLLELFEPYLGTESFLLNIVILRKNFLCSFLMCHRDWTWVIYSFFSLPKILEILYRAENIVYRGCEVLCFYQKDGELHIFIIWSDFILVLVCGKLFDSKYL